MTSSHYPSNTYKIHNVMGEWSRYLYFSKETLYLISALLNVIILNSTVGHYGVRNSNKQQGWPNNVQRAIQYQHITAILRELQHFRTAKCPTLLYDNGWSTLSIFFIEFCHALVKHAKVD